MKKTDFQNEKISIQDFKPITGGDYPDAAPCCYCSSQKVVCSDEDRGGFYYMSAQGMLLSFFFDTPSDSTL